MKLLVVADTTENWPEDIERHAAESDLVLSLGDMYSADIKRLTGNGSAVAGVYGNHCRPGYLKEQGAVELAPDGKICSTSIMRGKGASLSILGVNGCVRYSNAAHFQWTQEEYAKQLLKTPRSEWVVTHCPPLGVNDHDDPAHHGIAALTEYVRKNNPSHLFHGHTYPETLMSRLGNTKIHYVHGWARLEI